MGCTGEVPEEDDGTNGGPLVSVVKRRHVLEDASDGRRDEHGGGHYL